MTIRSLVLNNLKQIPAGSVLSAQGPLFAVALALFGPGTKKTYIYVDGFNLYYGAVKGTPLRWLNPVELARQVLPLGHQIEKLKYFTARVSGAADPGAPARQQQYLRALTTLPEVESHFGSFLSKTIWRPLTNLPLAEEEIKANPIVTLPTAATYEVTGSRAQRLPLNKYPSGTTRHKKTRRKRVHPLRDSVVAEVHAMEEKGSDVNLAAHLLNDAWKNVFDVAAVISNDTDLIAPIQMVTIERQKTVFVVCPGRWQASPKLVAVASHVRHIRKAMLTAAQFPDPIPGTTIKKPASW